MVGFPLRQSDDPHCLSIDWLEVCEAGYLRGLIASQFCAPADQVIDCPEPGIWTMQAAALVVLAWARRRRNGDRMRMQPNTPLRNIRRNTRSP